ncbi:OmpA family protein [Salipiger mucosus]|uniref:Outer membrane protein n=1 Tax=Salipiger mucosus DSM 16094 TaxID=1123237 RepID=S9QKJ6_9RHOB|nr:OmpA family protein [Salipiger mucosus]EPX81976.1 Outer membrane protein [Salipiger mucosus DSM 16094]
MKRTILCTTTALALATGLAMPRTAQAQDYGFDAEGMNAAEIREQLGRFKTLCEAGGPAPIPPTVNCDAVMAAEMPPEPNGNAPEQAGQPGNGNAPARNGQQGNADTPGQDQQQGNADATGQAQQQDNADTPGQTRQPGNAGNPGQARQQGNGNASGQVQAPGNGNAPGQARTPGNGNAPGQAPERSEQAREQREETPGVTRPAPGTPPGQQQARDNAQAEAPATGQAAQQDGQAAQQQDAPREVDPNQLADDLDRSPTPTPQPPRQAEPNPPQVSQQPAPAETEEAAPAQQADTEQDAEPTQQQAEPTPQTDPAQQQAEQAPQPQSPQQQAEAAARAEQRAQNSAAASADPDTAEAEVVEEDDLTEEQLRSSDEDFDTRIGQQPQQQTQSQGQRAEADDDDDDDNENLRQFGTAALLGLGAVALNEILGDNANVVENTGDRVVVEQDGQYRVLRNDDVLLRRPGSDVTTYRYDDGSTRSVVEYEDGNVVETVKAADGRVLRRIRTLPDGERVVLFDDTQQVEQVEVNELPQTTDNRRVNFREVSEDDLAAALASQETSAVERRFSLNQIRNIDAVRKLVPEVSVDTVNFETNSAAIRPEEAQELAALGNAMARMIRENPGEVFLVEGHTDAVGKWSYNLALSDRRAESVALALTEYFGVPPENLVLQGYGEGDLAVQTDTAERANRRAAVRRITPLLQGG